MPKTPKTQVVIAYIPVLHRGYMQLFAAFPDAKHLYVVAGSYLKKVDYLRKDLRALEPVAIVGLLENSGLFDSVQLLTPAKLRKLDQASTKVIMPDEDVSLIVGKHLKKAKVEYYPIFLRWDRRAAEHIDKKDPDEIVTKNKLHAKFLTHAGKIAGGSSDIWRRVGAVLVRKNGRILNYAVNQGEPTKHSPMMEGDPRNLFKRGAAIEMSVFTHAEAALIAEAARAGKSLKDAKLYVTTFPCPACAKLIAHSGIETVYYQHGYAVLDGKRVLSDYGVKIVRVDMPDKPDKSPVWVPYEK